MSLIVNCAAYTAVDKAEDDSELAYKLNSEAPKTLACAAQFNGAAIIQVSTDYVLTAPLISLIQKNAIHVRIRYMVQQNLKENMRY